MIRRYAHQGVQWVDLESPTADEVEGIADEFQIGANLLSELVTPTEKPRVDVYPDKVYAVFHFPCVHRMGGRDEYEEIDVVLGKNYLITTHYRPLETIDDFARAFEVAELLQRGENVTSGYLLFELAGRLYRASEFELDLLESEIAKIEQGIFSGRERTMVATISKAGRELVVHKRILGNHAATLDALERASISLFGDELIPYFRGVATLHYRALSRASSMADIMTELRETNVALISTRQNEIMKNLTIITAVMLPLTLVANIFSMNTRSVPLVGEPNGFWLVIGFMALVSLAFALYFKLKKWF